MCATFGSTADKRFGVGDRLDDATFAKSVSAGTADKKEDKKSGSDELLPLWCASSSKAADTSTNDGKAVQPELSPVAQPVSDGEQPEF